MTQALKSRLSDALADRYRIEREIGQGGMATVFLAEDLKHKRNVALKVLKPELAAVLGADRFVQEITTTAALQHPHILPRWSRDGLALFFRSEADELVRMPVEHRGDTLSFGAPRVLFSTRDFLPINPFQATYDVTPDGRFVMGRRLATVDGMESEQLIVVENFVDHLQRLMRP